MLATHKGPRVLVVDDEPSICRALQIAFMRHGYEVLAVGSGETALWLLRTEQFECMVVDLRIPDIRGDVLFELGASLQPKLRTNTIFTSGDTSDLAQLLVAACGCPLIAKPFDLTELIELVARMTQRALEA
jgi:DNA-binding NtrC family response regulator